MHPGEYNVYKFIKRGRGGMSRNAYLADLRIRLKMRSRAAGSSSATRNAKDGGGGVLISSPGDVAFGGEVRTAAGGVMVGD